ncbi:MAG: hypothetical protein R3D25_21140 [Geminicoccaceae bacterium]
MWTLVVGSAGAPAVEAALDGVEVGEAAALQELGLERAVQALLDLAHGLGVTWRLWSGLTPRRSSQTENLVYLVTPF